MMYTAVLLLLVPAFVAGQRSSCWSDQFAQDYVGTVAVTETGIPCQRWDEQSPWEHDRNVPEKFPGDDGVSAAENYCRNPDGEDYDGGPWCYTTDPDIRWQNCPVPQCSEALCKETDLGTEFQGAVSVTINGTPCQRWDEQSPHEHTRNNPDMFPEGDVSAAENFCRNPDDEEGGPWCYTTDPDTRWEFCDVPLCREECWDAEEDPHAQGFRGTVAVTVNGNTCQRWDEQSPQEHDRNVPEKFPEDADVSAAENYCRNPDNEDYEGGPWCYTTDPDIRWEDCPVSRC